MRQRDPRERGAALLLAFLAIMVLVVVVGQIAVTSATEQSIAYYSLRDLEYEYAARGGLEIAKAMLIKDLKDEQAQSESAETSGGEEGGGLGSIAAGQEQNESPTDSKQDDWADPEKSGEEFGDGISMKIGIIDEDSKFNLLTLAARDAEFQDGAHDRFVRLLDTFREDSKHDLTNGEATDLADRFTDWLTGKRDGDFPVPSLSSSLKEDEKSGAVFGKDRFAKAEEEVILYPLGLDELVCVDGMSDRLLHGFIEDGRYVPGLEDVTTIFSNVLFDEEAMAEEEEDGSVFGRPSDSKSPIEQPDEDEEAADAEAKAGADDSDLTGTAPDQATETAQGRLNINTTPMRVLRCLADSHDIPYSVLEKIDEFRREMFTEEYQQKHMGKEDAGEFTDAASAFGKGGEKEGESDSPWADEEEDCIFKNPGEVFDRVEEHYGMDFGLTDEIKQEFIDHLAVKSNVFTVILELRSTKNQNGSMFETSEHQAPPDRLYRAVVWRRKASDGKFQCITLVPLHPWAGAVPPDTEEYREEYPFGF
ncbi:MAG: hypothetical protein V2A76_15750 [Planctomycetota bacterium]